MKRYCTKPIDWVGFKQIVCPCCEKNIMVDTRKLENGEVIRCKRCEEEFMVTCEEGELPRCEDCGFCLVGSTQGMCNCGKYKW